MCGIVGGVAERNVVPILLEGLKRLEYRGYDSSGIAVLDESSQIQRVRALGKIRALEAKMQEPLPSGAVLHGQIGIAHTRWATHGKPAEHNAHPHICNQQIAVVHNGIIENYQQLKAEQLAKGYRFTSETDTEVVAHEVHNWHNTGLDLLVSVQKAIARFHGAYALGVLSANEQGRLVVARKGSPLVIGVGIGEYFIASDVSALLPVTQQFIFLEEGDVADIRRDSLSIYDAAGQLVNREVKRSNISAQAVELGDHQHYMHKEIFEQPRAVSDTLEGRVTHDQVLVNAFGFEAEAIFKAVKRVQMVACGTSYHAGLVAKYWFEDIIGLPCAVEVASEYRYRNPVVENDTLLVAISQSGETADTLAALQQIKQLRQQKNIPALTICNVPESSLTRECDLVLLTHAGPEMGVASTKAFTTQLIGLALLMMAIGKAQGRLSPDSEAKMVDALHKIPALIQRALAQEPQIRDVAKGFFDKHSALFLGRGTMYPIALEGALKLKEISYIHAEAYPAGELKHGPLALIDEHIPVVAVAPNDALLEKLKSNLQEVRARGGNMIVFEDEDSDIQGDAAEGFCVIKTSPSIGRISAPITFNIALQLLAYHVALIKGTDVDQPRNLAKSVTVE